MTTLEAADARTTATNGNIMASPFSIDTEFYFEIAVVIIGIVGTAGNALVLYALVASKQHKKYALIVNQNALDLFSSLFLVATYTVRLFNVYLRGVLGYWLCMILLSECPMWSCINGSIVNLAAVTVDRYLKIVHPIWSRKWLRPAVIRSAMAFAWIFGLVYNVIVVFNTSVVVDGVCYAFMYFVSDFARIMYGAWYFLTFYALILVIFLFCYGRILVAIRSN